MSLFYCAEDIMHLNRDTRTHLINAITGIKPGNLIGTVSSDGIENLAIFSSVVHIGSHPPLIGFIVRPQGRAPRDTYKNIRQTGYFTINQIPSQMIDQAHNTSVRFKPEINEFSQCGFEAEYLQDFTAPYVAESSIRIGLSLQNLITIPDNNAKMIIGHVEALHIDLKELPQNGQLNLEQLDAIGISGLNNYYSIKHQMPIPRTTRVSS